MSSNKNLKLLWPQNLLSDLGDGFTFETFNDDQLKGLYFAINTLREIERKALLLRYEQGKTSTEIASVINCSVGYVSVICSKARRHLRAPIRSRYILYGLQKERDRERKALEEKQRWIETIRNMQSIEEKIAALSHISLYEVGLSKIIIRKLRHLHIYGMSELIETVYSKAQKLSNTKKLSKEELDEIITQSSHKQLSLKHLLDKDFKSYLPLIMQQLTFSPAYDSLWIQ